MKVERLDWDEINKREAMPSADSLPEDHHPVRIINSITLGTTGEWYQNNYVICSCDKQIWYRYGISLGKANDLVRRHANGEGEP